MRFQTSVLILLMAWGAAPGVSAQTNAVRSVSLRDAIQMAIEHNFDVQIQRVGPEIARFNLESAYAYYVPAFQASAFHRSSTSEGGVNPQTGQVFPATISSGETLSLGLTGASPWGMTYNIGSAAGFSPTLQHHSDPTDFFDGSLGASISQPLLRGLTIDAERETILLSRKDLQISHAALANQLMQTISQVEQAYFDLSFARENIKVQEKALEFAEQHLSENRKRVEVGVLTPLDVKQAEAEVATDRASLLEAHQTYNTQQNTLKNLLTDNFSNWRTVEFVPQEPLLAVPERFDVMESWQRGLSGRPDLQQARLDLERRDIHLRFLRNQILPQLDLVGSAGYSGRDKTLGGVFEDELRARNPGYSVGAVFSVPLSTRGPRNRYNATKAEKEQSILRYKQLEQSVMVQIDNAIKEAQTSLQRVEATRKAREFREADLDAEQKKLEAGKSTSFFVLQKQRDLTIARSEEIRALADYNKALSQLSFSQGATLEHYHISLNGK